MSPPLAMEADDRLTITTARGAAEALLWWTRVPNLPGERLGVVGAFTASDREAATTLLNEACRRLRALGCTRAVGPMDGNTWRRYRFVTEDSGAPAFFLEPSNPAAWPGWWEESGFVPLAQYYSARTKDLAWSDPRRAEQVARAKEWGVTLRPLEAGSFEAELDRIYDVSLAAFQSNYLYTPLPRADFIAQYRAVQPLVRPELVCLAEREGKPVGYMFAIPDQAQAARGESVTDVIMKTIAVLPEFAGAGLGSLLFAEVHGAARRLGYQRAVHALMHEENRSRRMSAHSAEIMRRYTLFARRLDA